MRRNDDAEIFVLFGILFGAFIVVALMWHSGVTGHHDFMSKYDGLEHLVSEMQDECDAQEGVTSCVWDEKELDFVPEND